VSGAIRSKVALVLLAIFLLAASAVVWVWSQRSSLKIAAVRIGMPVSKVRFSYKTFRYNEQGHFDNKTQYESCSADPLGGGYSLHCRDGKVYAVEVNYPKGADRARALEMVSNIVGQSLEKSEEHDDKELSLENCDEPSEYFYFDGGKIGVQLDFHGNRNQVTRVYCWSA
jgi:hypothetical protein